MIYPRIVIFDVVQIATCIYALRRGGEPERLTAAMMAAATLGSGAAIALLGIHRAQANPALMSVDAALLVGLVCLAARANRFWPLWVAGCQLCALLFHLAYQIEPLVMPGVYNRTLGKMAYPMMALLAVGTFRYAQRARLAVQRDWSPFRW